VLAVLVNELKPSCSRRRERLWWLSSIIGVVKSRQGVDRRRVTETTAEVQDNRGSSSFRNFPSPYRIDTGDEAYLPM